MLKVDTKSTFIPSVATTIQTLTAHNLRFGIPLDYDRLLEYDAYYTIKAYGMQKVLRQEIMPNSPTREFNLNVFKDWMRKVGVNKITESTADDELEAAVATGLFDEYICDIINLYRQYSTSLRKVSLFQGIMAAGRISRCPTFDNRRMLLVKPEWHPQNTGRVAMRNPALQNVPKELSDIQTAPKGYVLVETDSGQIEPRLIQSLLLKDPQLKKCTMLYNDAYFGYLHYCTILTDAERASGTLDIVPIELTDEMKAKRKKFKTYGNATMYGSTENKDNDPDKAAFIKYIGGHPNRVKLQREVESAVTNGKRVFETVFGSAIDITKGPSDGNYADKNSNAYFSHLVKCAINNPIQGTAADLMRLSVSRANKLLLDNAPNSWIAKYTHDSGTFIVAEDEFDKVGEELKDITSYQVDDWIPIYAEPVVGVDRSQKLKTIL